MSTVSELSNPFAKRYVLLNQQEIDDLRSDKKDSLNEMQAFGNDPSNIATMRPGLREAVLKNKPHLRAAVENLLRKAA